MKWKKLGKIFEVNKNYDWMVNYATCPFSYHLKDDVFRIFFSTRNKDGYSFGAWVDININDIGHIINISNEPNLSPGKFGLFDDAGVVPFQIIENNNKLLLFYSGWSLKKTVPFDFHIGLAQANTITNKFIQYSKVPILDRTENEPYLIGAPFVIIENDIWKMWYVSGDEWVVHDGENRHYYSIKYAYSKNGIDWIREGIKCIFYANEYEYAFARPFVLQEGNIYKMWYSFRAQKNIDSYRIGYAESNNGIDWIRKDDEVGIDVSSYGWDSEMICYPYIFDHKGKRYMLYNGNDYGKTGFGLAVLEES